MTPKRQIMPLDSVMKNTVKVSVIKLVSSRSTVELVVGGINQQLSLSNVAEYYPR